MEKTIIYLFIFGLLEILLGRVFVGLKPYNKVGPNLHHCQGHWPWNLEALKTHPKVVSWKIEIRFCVVTCFEVYCSIMCDPTLNPMIFQHQPIHMDPLIQQVIITEGLWYFQWHGLPGFLLYSISWSRALWTLGVVHHSAGSLLVRMLALKVRIDREFREN